MATYWVATSGDDGNDGLSDTNAWATVQHAADTVVAGDTVIFKDGTWDIGSTIDFDTHSGSDGQEITFRAENRRQVVWKRGFNGGAVVEIDQHYLTFDGIVIDGDASGDRTGYYAFKLVAADNITISDCEIRDLQGWGIQARSGCDNLTIEDTKIDLGYFKDGETFDGIRMGQWSNSNLTIRNTEICNTDHVGINVAWAEGFLIADCVVHDTNSHGIQFGDDDEAIPAGSISGTARDNTIYNVGEFGDPEQSPNAFFMWCNEVGEVRFYRNTIYAIRSTGFHVRADVTGPVYIYNNTLYNFNTQGRRDRAGIYLWTPGSERPTIRVKNNIIYNTYDGGETLRVLGTVNTNLDCDHNLYYADHASGEEVRRGGVTYRDYGAYRAAGHEPNTVVGQDPLFDDAAGAGFTLQDGSPASGAGADVGLPYDPPAPDIGAYDLDDSGPTPDIADKIAQAIEDLEECKEDLEEISSKLDNCLSLLGSCL